MIPKDAPKVSEDKNIKNVIAVMSGKGREIGRASCRERV